MHRHCGANNIVPRWTFTDPCKPEVRPGSREESASPAWLAAPAMNARDTTKVYIWRLETGCGRLTTQANRNNAGIIVIGRRYVTTQFPNHFQNNLQSRMKPPLLSSRPVIIIILKLIAEDYTSAYKSTVFTSGV